MLFRFASFFILLRNTPNWHILVVRILSVYTGRAQINRENLGIHSVSILYNQYNKIQYNTVKFRIIIAWADFSSQFFVLSVYFFFEICNVIRLSRVALVLFCGWYKLFWSYIIFVRSVNEERKNWKFWLDSILFHKGPYFSNICQILLLVP
jgi:hypothetical protein